MTQSVVPRSAAGGERRAVDPGMVRSASLAMAISAPVLPPDSAASAWPSFTALIARPIEVVLARRIAWLGFSDARSSRCNGGSTRIDQRLMLASSGAIFVFVAEQLELRERSLRRARAMPAIITAGPCLRPWRQSRARGLTSCVGALVRVAAQASVETISRPL